MPGGSLWNFGNGWQGSVWNYIRTRRGQSGEAAVETGRERAVRASQRPLLDEESSQRAPVSATVRPPANRLAFDAGTNGSGQQAGFIAAPNRIRFQSSEYRTPMLCRNLRSSGVSTVTLTFALGVFAGAAVKQSRQQSERGFTIHRFL
jgi:hypothetical protein